MSQAQRQHDPSAPAQPAQSGAEKRRHKRRSGMWKAHVELGHGYRVDCVILDLSDGGAKIMLKQPVAIGKVVTLVADCIGARGARVCWSEGHRAGVQFIEGSAEVVAAVSHRAATRDSVWSAPPPPAPTPAPQPAGLNAQFMRGRAAVLRRMAETNPDPEKAATLLRSAEAMEAEAAQIDRQQRF
jgi:PilZ domain